MVRISAAFRSVRSVAGGVARRPGVHPRLADRRSLPVLSRRRRRPGLPGRSAGRKGRRSEPPPVRRHAGHRTLQSGQIKTHRRNRLDQRVGLQRGQNLSGRLEDLHAEGRIPCRHARRKVRPHRRPHDRLCRLPHRVARGAEDPAPHRQRRRFQSLAERQTCRLGQLLAGGRAGQFPA